MAVFSAAYALDAIVGAHDVLGIISNDVLCSSPQGPELLI